MSIELKSCFASLPKTERGRSIVLGGDPKGKNFLYCHGTDVIIRNIENPNIIDLYTEHQKEAVVAKYSPSGFYIASGDVTGKVRIWDTVNKEHILKSEFHPISGKITDIAWSPDNTKLALVGEGREFFAQCITYDSGNTVGKLLGHTKAVNSVAYKPTRPFRIATGSEDFSVGFFEGPPFKWTKSLKEHTNFVNTVRYSPNGEVFATGCSSRKLCLYDGKTGDFLGEVGESTPHTGGIYGIDFSPDGKKLLSVSGDKTAKIWDVETRQLDTEFKLGTDTRDMQLGCLWQGDHILTVSLSGYINYLDRNNPDQPIRVIRGFNKPITALKISPDKSTVYTGSVDGSIKYWDPSSGQCEEIQGKGHTNQVQDMVMDEDTVISIGLDDTFRMISATSKEYGSVATKTDSQPKSVSTCSGTTAIACVKHIMILEGERKLSAIGANYDPECITLHPGKTQVAVGGTNTVAVYNLSGGALSQSKLMSIANCNISDIKYSPDGAFLAAVGSDKRLYLYNVVEDYKEVCDSQGHTARICCVAWSPDSSHVATSSIDGSIGVWIPVKAIDNKIAQYKFAHVKSWANKIEWLDNNTVLSVGQDSTVKQWTVKF